MPEYCVITRKIVVAKGVYAPGHLGELTQILDHDLVDAVIAETGSLQRRVRLLPTRVVVYFVLALALFESCGYLRVWAKLVAGMRVLAVVTPSASALCRARQRVGVAPFRALFDAVSGLTARPDTPGAFWRRLRVVGIDATTMHVPDTAAIRARYPRRGGARLTFGYPLLRLTVLIECGTRAVFGAVFGPESEGETTHAHRLVDHLGAGMLLLADAGYDSWRLLTDIAATGAHYLCRSSASRIPPVLQRLPDGSYLSQLGPDRLPVRVVEAWITVTWADGTITHEQWRLITDLLDPRRYPADALLELYHRRWQVETTFLSIKATILDGRVLRSAHPDDIAQEVYALLTVYQAIVRTAVDAVDTRPHTRPDRISFTIALETARDQVTTASAIVAPPGARLIGAIGEAVLAGLLTGRRWRSKARWRKNPNSKYAQNAKKFPHITLRYTITTTVMIMEQGLTTRPHR